MPADFGGRGRGGRGHLMFPRLSAGGDKSPGQPAGRGSSRQGAHRLAHALDIHPVSAVRAARERPLLGKEVELHHVGAHVGLRFLQRTGIRAAPHARSPHRRACS
jgi:hypothetical protein